MQRNDFQNSNQKQNESPKSTKLMHTLDRRLQYLNKVQVKIDASHVLDTQYASEYGIPQSARNSYKQQSGQIDVLNFNSVILPNINLERDYVQNNIPQSISSIKNASQPYDFTKKFQLKEEYLDGYSINSKENSQQQASFSPSSKNKRKFMQLRSFSQHKRSPNSSMCSQIRQSNNYSPKQLEIHPFQVDQDSSIQYEQNYESTLSLNYQGKTFDFNQIKQIPSIINELSTMIDGTFKEGKKFDDPLILQTFYKSIRQIIEIDLIFLEEQKLDKNNKNKLHLFNDKIQLLKDKLIKLKDVEGQIAMTININDEMQLSQKKLIRIKKQHDKTLDNLDFFMQILEQYDYPESSTSMIMLKMKQNEYTDLIELQQQSANEYRDSMLDPTNPANSITAYRYDRIRKIKEFIKQKKIRNAQKITNL